MQTAPGSRSAIERPPPRYVVDARAFNDAVAFRIVVEGTGRRVPDAATSFQLPAGSILWSHGLRDHYEALYERRRIDDVREGEWAAPPITVKLPGSAGYAAITEADLRNYAGMALQADGRGGLHEKLAHDHPPGYPYTLRFGEDNAKRLAVAAPIDGRITTPWRVVIVGRDLNALVNSDAVASLCPPPDPAMPHVHHGCHVDMLIFAMVAGHADYTPVVFGERRRETSWAHQIASAAILTSPLLVYGGHSASLLANPAVDMIKSIPSVWV